MNSGKPPLVQTVQLWKAEVVLEASFLWKVRCVEWLLMFGDQVSTKKPKRDLCEVSLQYATPEIAAVSLLAHA